MTSPHLFDAGDTRHGQGVEEEALDNRAALHWAVLETNRLRLAEGRSIDFVVITGGFGLNNVTLPERPGVSKRRCECPKERFELEGPIAPTPLAAAAAEVARELSALLVNRVLVVPGTSDLCDGQEDDRHRWAEFVHALRGALREHASRRGMGLERSYPRDRVQSPIVPEIEDLTYSLERLYAEKNPRIHALFAGTAGPGPVPSTPLRINGIDLIGLDSAYFKPQKAGMARKVGHAAALKEMAFVRDRLVRGGSSLIFTHRADLPDLLGELAGQPGALLLPPSWDLPKDARAIWDREILGRGELIGVFAGHFHAPVRELYPSGFSVLKPAPNLATLTKTWVTPPLAAKHQVKVLPEKTARGMLLVSATTSGAVRVAAPLWFTTPDQKAAVDGDDKLVKARAEAWAGNWEEAAKGYEQALTSTDSRARATAIAGYEHARAKTRTWWWEAGRFVPLLRWSVTHPWRAFWFAAFVFLGLPLMIWMLRKVGFFWLIGWPLRRTLKRSYRGRARLNATTEMNKGAPVDVFWAQMSVATAEIHARLRREQTRWMAGQVPMLASTPGAMDPLIKAIPKIQGVPLSEWVEFFVQLGRAFQWNVDSRLALFPADGLPAPGLAAGPASMPDRGQFSAQATLRRAWGARTNWQRSVPYAGSPNQTLADLAREMAELIVGEAFV